MRKLVAAMIGTMMLSAIACGEDKGSVTVSLSFPSSATEANTDTVHVYVLEPNRPDGDDEEVGCPELIGDVLDPLSSKFGLRGDVVIRFDGGEGTTTAELLELERGRALIYAEASNAVGQTLLAGCVEDSVGGGTDITLTMVVPGTFDCSDPATPNGAACDDGTFCTTGKVCQDGECTGGGPRDCTFLEDDCNGSECSEELGCQPVVVPDGRDCEDGMFCTSGDTCQSGECVGGGPTDCTGVDTECGTGVCSEEVDSCVLELSDATCEALNDNDVCTVDVCELNGMCSIPEDACVDPGEECYTVSCTEVSGEPDCTYTAQNPGGDCDDWCMTGGTCSDVECTGGTPTGNNIPETGNLCFNGIDDDCDGLIDDDDTLDCP